MLRERYVYVRVNIEGFLHVTNLTGEPLPHMFHRAGKWELPMARHAYGA